MHLPPLARWRAHARLLVVLVSLGGTTVVASPLDLHALAAQSIAERRATLARSRDSVEAALKAAPAEAILELMEKSDEQLGTYRAKLEKRERIDGEMSDLQTLKLTIHEKPHAIRAEFVAGPSSGRKAVYDASVRQGEVRVKEAGLLGLAGAVWLSVDNSLTRRDTNHPITDLGFGPLIALLRADFHRAAPFGGFARHDEGFDAQGRFCTRYTAPEKATGLYARSARICVDPVLMLPTRVEVEDAKGPLEQLTYSDVTPAPDARFGTSL